MDIYRSALDYLLDLPDLQKWAEVQALLKRYSARKPYFWQLPIMACKSVGGSIAQAIPGVAAAACLHTSILLIDDMLDADPKGEYHRIGQAATANLAAALQAAGLEAITRCEHHIAIKLSVLDRLNQMVLTTALGQSWDVQNPQDETTYWHVVQTKSAPFFGVSLYSGAMLGGASEETATQLEQLGHLYGEMIQIHDDLSDVMEMPANPDWTLGRSPLPVLYAQVVPHPDRARFLELRQAIPDLEALAEAQTILIQCGAISYAIDQLLRRYWQAQKILATISLVHQENIEELLDSVVNPVREILAVAGVTHPEALLSFTLPQPEPVV